jgi:hypothetical protein
MLQQRSMQLMYHKAVAPKWRFDAKQGVQHPTLLRSGCMMSLKEHTHLGDDAVLALFRTCG